MKPRWLLIVLGACVLTYLLGTCSGKRALHDAVIVAKAEATLASGKVYHDSLQRAQDALAAAQSRAALSEQRFRQRGALVAKLDTALSRAVNTRDSVPILLHQNVVLRGQVDALQQENLDLGTAMEAVRAQRDLAEDRVDSLEARLSETLTVATCHWDLGLVHPKCPSRTTVGLVGIGTGLVAGLLLSK